MNNEQLAISNEQLKGKGKTARAGILSLVFFLITAHCSLLTAVDFGLMLEQKLEIDNDFLVYTPGFNPWFSYTGESGLSVYLSASLSIPYTSYDGEGEWKFTPELTRSSISYRINQSMSFEAGRIIYADVSGLTASGLYDGARFNMGLSFGNLSFSALYSGLQFKETAKIIMSEKDMEDFSKPWDMDSFGDYFASSRVLAAVRGDFPLSGNLNLSAELLAQFDVNGNDDLESLHSQYGIVLADFYPSGSMKVTAGVLFSLLQYADETGIGFGAMAQFKMNLPTAFNDQLGASVKFASGSDDSLDFFIPINSHSQGMVFPETFSGLAVFGINYDIRIINSLYAEAGFDYFMRTYSGEGGNLYGGEFSGTVAFQPFDDLRATIGGGVFIPGMGNYFPDNTDAMWKISIGLVWSL